MNFLDLINSVMRRLRENTVTGIAENSYSIMIGDLINDAKTTVENSHEWTSLRQTIVVPTVDDQSTYAITGAYQDAILKEVMNDTSNWYLNGKTRHYFNNQNYLGTSPKSSPDCFTWNGTDATGQLQVDVYPIPDAIYQLRFDMVIPQPALNSGATFLKVPSNPVIQLALAMALRERGETGGQSGAEQFGIASIALGDSIQLDANKYQNELTFVAV